MKILVAFGSGYFLAYIGCGVLLTVIGTLFILNAFDGA